MKRSTLAMATSTPSMATDLAPIVSPCSSTSRARSDSPTRSAVSRGASAARAPWDPAHALRTRSGYRIAPAPSSVLSA